MNRLKEYISEASGHGCDDGVIAKFQTYMDMVLEWNEKVNLTAITDKDEFITKHFIDSLCCIGHEQYKSAKRVVDVGTGAGFPGLPLAIVSPDKEFLLIDSLNKRIRILNEIIEAIGLTNVKAIHGRAEELARNKSYRESFDVCVSRAVSRMSVLSEYCLPFVKKGGWLIAYKGPDAENEIADAKRALGVLGGKVMEVAETDMQSYDIFHKIVYVKKTMSTPNVYPRKAGTPDKQPIK